MGIIDKHISYKTSNNDEFYIEKVLDLLHNKLRLQVQVEEEQYCVLVFNSSEEIDEFCEILQQHKNEIWPEVK